MQSLPATRNGRNTNSRPNRVIRICGLHSSPRINRASIGKSGSPPWGHPRNIPGRYISSGNCCTAILERFLSLAAIHSPLDRRTTFVHDFTVTASPRRAIPPGGNANQSLNGYPPSLPTLSTSAAPPPPSTPRPTPPLPPSRQPP